MRRQLSGGIIREFRHMHDGIHSCQVRRLYVSEILEKGIGACRAPWLQRPVLVEAGVEAAAMKFGREQRTSIPFCAGYENTH